VLLAFPGRPDLRELSITASAVWLLLDDTCSTELLVEELADLYDAQAEEIRPNVEELVSELVSEEVLECAEPISG
jgi:coenzyme PQQ synthesis protein D (PqqD)